jgi:hypothetical protein
MYKIVMWGTTNQGDGHVMRLGEYESIEDLRIYTAMLGMDIMITFTEELPEDEIGPIDRTLNSVRTK